MIEFGRPNSLVVPTLLTDRLVLRGWRASDVGVYAEMAADPDMARYTGSPKTWQATWNMIASLSGHWQLRGFGMWCAGDRHTGEFLGRVGLFEGPGWPGVEVAWTIRRDKWNHGLATEGGAAALWFAFAHLNLDRVISLIHPDNVASRRVAVKLGLSEEKVEDFPPFGGLTAFYVVSRTSWASRSTNDSAGS